MEFKALLLIVWLLSAVIPTRQELVRLRASPKITAECGKQITLNCDVSSSRIGLSVKLMEWSLNKTLLCSVDNEQKPITHPAHHLSRFHCEYQHGQLSLVFNKVRPADSASFRCKLRSNKGAAHESTNLELQDCSGIIEGHQTRDSKVCTFNHVYPDGDVHWLHGSHNLTARSPLVSTTKHVDRWGWRTIHSHLEHSGAAGPYNCSLMSTRSRKYFASALVQHPAFPDLHTVRGGAGAQKDILLSFSVLLAVTLL